MNPIEFINHLINRAKSLEELGIPLFILISNPSILENGQWIENRQLVDRINNLKIIINANDHLPPHFHVLSPDINASFRIDDCSLLKGNVPNNKLRAINYWYKFSRQKLYKIWLETVIV